MKERKKKENIFFRKFMTHAAQKFRNKLKIKPRKRKSPAKENN